MKSKWNIELFLPSNSTEEEEKNDNDILILRSKHF